MSKLRITALVIAAGLIGLAATSAAQQVTVQYLLNVMATDLNADGSVIVGNQQGNYETFRWTEATGVQLLGRSTFDVLGVGAGGPKVSADGTRVSATILGEDETYATQGRWTQGVGWQETMPPAPADGGLFDQSYGSAWGLSGDGTAVVGLYWRPGAADGVAHAGIWTEATGVVGLGSGGGNSRANACSQDGSVVVGWDENPNFGTWWPTVWREGVRTVLAETEGWCLANCVTDDGSIIGGVGYDNGLRSRSGALWRWNGSTYEEELIGLLPGSTPGDYAQAIVNGITPDGSMAVGYNQFAFNPGNSAGFIWTPEEGMINATDFLVGHGISLPAGFTLQTLTAVSDDGSVLVGIGQYADPPYDNATVIIRIETTTGAPDATPVAADLVVGPNFPNPFNPQTSIPVSLARAGTVTLEVYDAAGRLVRSLHRGHLASGSHEFRWNGSDDQGRSVPSGVYLARLADGRGQVASRRLTLMK
jgi:uncharacterized membrane protein